VSVPAGTETEPSGMRSTLDMILKTERPPPQKKIDSAPDDMQKGGVQTHHTADARHTEMPRFIVC